MQLYPSIVVEVVIVSKYEGKTVLSVILEGSNKGAKIELLKVIVSYVLNTVIPVFALMKSNRPTFRLVNHPEFSAGIKGMLDFRPTSLSDTEKRTTHQALLPYLIASSKEKLVIQAHNLRNSKIV